MTALSQGRDASPPLSHREGCTDGVWRWSKPGVYGDGIDQKPDAHSDARRGVHL